MIIFVGSVDGRKGYKPIQYSFLILVVSINSFLEVEFIA
jgi:hypothetical protein